MKYKSEFWKLLLTLFSNDGTFTLSIFVIFMISQGLSFSQVSLVISASFFATAIGAIPAGIIADRYGYKKALLWGSVLFLAGTILFAFGRNFYWFVIGFALLGLGASLKQGSIYAQLYETLKSYGREADFKKIAGKLELYMNLFWVFATITGGLMYSLFNRLPFFAEVVLAGISLIAVLMIREIKLEKNEASVFTQTKASIKYAFSTTNFSKIFIFSAFIGSIAVMTIQYTQPLFSDFEYLY